MKKKRIVVALGGNALGNTPTEQLKAVRIAAEAIVDLIAQGHELIIGHGNGPQVGMINNAMCHSASSGPLTPYIPFAECGAMSQGYIGYHLQQALQEKLAARKLNKTAVSIITQVVVEENDPAFKTPTKPIGTFYTKDEALRLAAENGWAVSEDAGRGYRRVVPSPVPVRIVELDAVQHLVENDVVVVTVGGGGIPVLDTAEGYKGIDAVIDKDRSCSRLARDLNADVLLILTAVDAVKINFGKENEETLYSATPQELAKYAAQGHFAPGSMLPKVEACIDFVQDDCTRTAIISSLALAGRSLETGVGTKISNIV